MWSVTAEGYGQLLQQVIHTAAGQLLVAAASHIHESRTAVSDSSRLYRQKQDRWAGIIKVSLSVTRAALNARCNNAMSHHRHMYQW